MKKRISLTAFIVPAILLQSCIITQTPGFYSGYSRLPEDEKEKIVFLNTNDTVRSLKKENRLYAVTGELLRKCIETEEKAMVYIWSPFCSSDRCYPLFYVQSYCNSRGITLYVVAEYYDSNRMQTEQKNISAPVVSVNEKHYGTGYCRRYMKLFIGDLLGKDTHSLSEEERYSSIYLFNSGKPVPCSSILEGDEAVK
ncbi:MAG: hypothetical protein LBV41_10765 [Cytophagaceae bacterium]|jgi:hypothetical protein|nr:hypothetical protein [Cytophagaceae bacterium]